MAFRAVHAEWGEVFAHLPDLGCGQIWEAVWKARPAAPLACDECGHRMFAKVSRGGLRFFAHAPGAPTCALALETIAHHLLKLELANAARASGVHAEMEVRGPDGAWRADVMASDPGGAWRWALEAQLAPITADDIYWRTIRMAADGVWSIWFSDKPKPPWLGIVPSVRLARPEDGGDLVVAEGLVKWDGCQWQAVPASLTEFLGWAFTGRITNEAPQDIMAGSWFWTAPRYRRAWDEYLAEIKRQSARPRRRELTQEQIAAARNRARLEAARAESAASRHRGAEVAARRERTARRPEVAQAIAQLAQRGKIASVGWSIGQTRYAGIPLVNADGWLVAILDPDPRRIGQKQFALHAGTLLLFTSEDRQARFARVMKDYEPKPQEGWKTDHC